MMLEMAKQAKNAKAKSNPKREHLILTNDTNGRLMVISFIDLFAF